MSDEPRIWKVFKAGLYDRGELVNQIDLGHMSQGQPEMVEFSFYVEALQEIGRANAKIESLQRENAALRGLLDRRGNLSKHVDSGNLMVEQESTAITPEQRERIEAYLKPGSDYPTWYGRDLLRELLGEQEEAE